MYTDISCGIYSCNSALGKKKFIFSDKRIPSYLLDTRFEFAWCFLPVVFYPVFTTKCPVLRPAQLE